MADYILGGGVVSGNDSSDANVPQPNPLNASATPAVMAAGNRYLDVYGSKTMDEAIVLSKANLYGIYFCSDTNDIVLNGRKYTGSSSMNIEGRYFLSKKSYQVYVENYIPGGYLWLYRKISRSKFRKNNEERINKSQYIPFGLTFNCLYKEYVDRCCIPVTEDMAGKWISVDEFLTHIFYKLEDVSYTVVSQCSRRQNVREVKYDKQASRPAYPDETKAYYDWGVKYVVPNPAYTGSPSSSGIEGGARPMLLSSGEMVKFRTVIRAEYNRMSIWGVVR